METQGEETRKKNSSDVRLLSAVCVFSMFILFEDYQSYSSNHRIKVASPFSSSAANKQGLLQYNAAREVKRRILKSSTEKQTHSWICENQSDVLRVWYTCKMGNFKSWARSHSNLEIPFRRIRSSSWLFFWMDEMKTKRQVSRWLHSETHQNVIIWFANERLRYL